LAQAEALGFSKSCLPETGRLLQTLASAVMNGVIGELGAGCGYGTTWLTSGLRPGVRLVTVEHAQRLAGVVHDVMQGIDAVTVVTGDWREALCYGPFELLFVDVSEAKDAAADETIAALAPGGIAVLDDLTAEEHWPREWRGKLDALRELWLGHPALHAVELRTSARDCVILAVKR
jgi:predicted O-methyltransferase YrrM